MLSLTNNIQVQNLTRIKVQAFILPDLDVFDYMTVQVAVLGPGGGQPDVVQLARAYSIQTLKIRNGACDAISFATDPTVNPYNGLIVRTQIVSPELLDTCVSAINAAGKNIRNQHKAIETALSTAGVLPPGTVA